jgi:hypothetical protein
MRTLLLIFVFSLLAFIQPTQAQVDTRFWFAVPEITEVHADRPIVLRISALLYNANITVSLPANPTFRPIQISVPANTTHTLDLTNYISMLENIPANTVLPNGLLLESDKPVSAYYEVIGYTLYGSSNNSDIFVLKGNHALGNEFYIPFQTHWDNHPTQNAWASFDIVATENNTTVTITPTQDLVGHAAGTTFQIVLQKGQTYSAQAASHLGSLRPVGSKVTSDKPIAITVKDDSILESPNYDILGDQLIPTKYIGTEYIALKTSDSINTDRVYILATKASTSVFLDGNPAATTVLNAGEVYEHHLLSPSVYIQASDSVYVWHVTGFAQELGGAILPPLACTGSRQVSFTRSSNEDFLLALVVRSGFTNDFRLNNNPTLIPASSFSPVPGTSGQWQYAQISFDEYTLLTDVTHTITNDNADFQLSILNGGTSTSFRYGFFSDFGFLELGSDRTICTGDSILLDAGFFKDNYIWSSSTDPNLSNQPTLMVKDSGMYWIEVTKGICQSKDSIRINFHPPVTDSILVSDTAFCTGTNYAIGTMQPFHSYRWSTGSSFMYIKPTQSGLYWVEVSNEYGCKKKDTIDVTIHPLPEPKIETPLQELEQFCKNATVHLISANTYVNYQWSTGETTKEIFTTHHEEDTYTLEVTDLNGCKNETTYSVDCSIVIGLIPNLLTPNGDMKNELFFIEYLRSNKWILEIYNGWGGRVYYKDGYDNTFDSNVLDDGIYYFALHHKDEKITKKGWLQILR